MSDDGRERLGQTAMNLLDRLIEQHGEDVEIGRVVVVAEVNDGENNRVEVESSDTRVWVVHGLLSIASEAQHSRYELDDEGED